MPSALAPLVAQAITDVRAADMGILTNLRTLLSKPSPVAAELETAIGEAEEQRCQAEAQLAELRAASGDRILQGDAAWAAHKAAVTGAQEDVESLAAVVETLSVRLEEARQSEAKAEQARAYKRAIKVRNEAAKLLVSELEAINDRYRMLLRRVLEADAVVLGANELLPDGADPIESVEAYVRDRPGRAERILRTRKLKLWAYPSGRLLPIEDQRDVRQDRDGNHFVSDQRIRQGRKSRLADGNRHPVVEAEFLHIVGEKHTRREFGPRLVQQTIPGIRAGDPPVWLGVSSGRDPAQLLQRLNDLASRSCSPEEVPEAFEEYRLVDIIKSPNPERPYGDQEQPTELAEGPF